MKKSSFLALAVAPMILGAPLASQAQSVTTDPVGFVKSTLEAGKLTPVGISLLKPAVYAGKVEAASASVITVAGAPALGSLLDSSGAYYVEITGGALTGDRIDVDLAATLNANDGELHLSVSADHNTIDSGSAISADSTFVIRPHFTLGDVTELVGADNLHTGTDIPDTDQVLTYEGGSFVTHGYFDGVWYDGQFNEVDDKILPPGSGFLFRRQGSDTVELTPLGEVRSNDFVLPLSEGLQMVSFGFPVDRSPADYGMTTEYFTGAELDFSEGDQILTYGDGSFNVHALFNDNEWYDGQFNTVTSEALFAADGAVLVRMHQADPDFRIVKPY